MEMVTLPVVHLHSSGACQLYHFLFTPERMRLRRGWGDNDDGFRSSVSAGGCGLRGVCIYQ